jgi:hypothetical protein
MHAWSNKAVSHWQGYWGGSAAAELGDPVFLDLVFSFIFGIMSRVIILGPTIYVLPCAHHKAQNEWFFLDFGRIEAVKECQRTD